MTRQDNITAYIPPPLLAFMTRQTTLLDSFCASAPTPQDPTPHLPPVPPPWQSSMKLLFCRRSS
jgi:hypothetical protein